MIRSNEPPLVHIRKSVFSLLRSLPWVRRKLEADLAKAQVEIEEEVHQYDHVSWKKIKRVKGAPDRSKIGGFWNEHPH